LHDVQTLMQHVTSGIARCADSDATCYINLCMVCRLWSSMLHQPGSWITCI